MIKTKVNNKGFALFETMIAMTVVMMMMTSWVLLEGIKAKNETAKTARSRIEVVINKLQQYYMDQMLVTGLNATDINNYPSSMSQLQSAGYIPTCSGTDQANGLCVDSTVLPWGTGSGEEITISRRLDAQGYPQAVISFDLSTESREDMRRRFRSQLSRLFGYLENASGQVTYAIDRPSQALMMDGFVSRDGDRDMTGTDWDYGGTATLDNVVDVSYTGITDRTAITGLLKNGSKIVTSSAGVPVSKPTCPSGYTPTITTYLVGIGYDTEYTEVGNVDTWYTDSGSSTWTVFLRFAALDLTHSASVRTWHHRGSVGYFTWCDL